ncbi:MAG: 3-phosphoshikimate 1-carboxyvinyltransferase [Kiritimatiellae bacterium]|nr:3-phosphoshikimate 1-carboxyvinyltransferase [Kiritimatiellia bacterium]
MNLNIHPGRALRGEVVVPGDKSLAHRAALLAACSTGESVVDNYPLSGVTRAMLKGLKTLGVPWRLEGGRLIVHSDGLRAWRAPSVPLDCGNSATTMRLLTGALAASGLPAALDGSAGLRRRPMTRIVEPLRRMGVSIEAAHGGCAPLRLTGRDAGVRLRGLEIELAVASAQVKSCLLLAGLAADGPLTVREPGPSRDHTERMLRGMGVKIETDDEHHVVRLFPPAGPLPPLHLILPGDLSSAAFLIVGALIAPGSDLQLRGVGLNPGRTGLLDTLREMGADITTSNTYEQGGEPVGDLRVRASRLHAVTVHGDRVVRMIDEFPALAVAAACASGTTEVRDAAELRHKESDRIGTLCSELMRVGINIRERPGGFVVAGEGIAGGTAAACGDHRLAMALTVAGLAARRPVTVQEAGIASESYPSFYCTLTRLGASLIARAPPGEQPALATITAEE